MIELGSFRNTAAMAVTTEPDMFTAPGPQSIFDVWADRSIMMARNGALINDKAYLLRENTHARVRLEKNEVLTFALADGETDGMIYITEVTPC